MSPKQEPFRRLQSAMLGGPTDTGRVALSRVALLAPVVFMLHVAEEAPGFVEWFNSLVARGITESLFLQVNGVALLITTACALVVFVSRSSAAAMVMVTWLSLLFLANSLVHVVGTLAHARYAPGTITAVLLYLPYYIWFIRLVRRECRFATIELIPAVLLGAAPMLVHGYLIIFRGDRLF